MSFIELLFYAIVLYYILYIVIYAILDSNFILWYKQRYGVPISTMRGQVVWVTGASSGIGRALAVYLARQGVRLVLSARRQAQLDEVQAECLQQAGGLLTAKDVLVLPMDMLEIEKHEEIFRKVVKHFGRLDILVNNAGRSQRAAWESIDVQVDRELFELDVFSVIHLSRLVVRYFLQEAGGRGHIACTSSVAGMAPIPFSATYVAAKHALNAYMLALQVEHPEINVTVFAPGPIHTDFLQEAFTADTETKVGETTSHQRRMTAERCAELYGVALVNKVKLSWCGLFAVNLLVLVCRDPLYSYIAYNFNTSAIMSRIREGKI